MHLSELSARALEIHAAFGRAARRRGRRPWSRAEVMQGFVGDVGDLMKLTMARDGRREIAGADRKVAHELADCLWSVLVLAELHGVDLEPAFRRTMDQLEAKLRPARRRR